MNFSKPPLSQLKLAFNKHKGNEMTPSKKLWLLCLAALFSLGACGGDNETDRDNGSQYQQSDDRDERDDGDENRNNDNRDDDGNGDNRDNGRDDDDNNRSDDNQDDNGDDGDKR
ncbi:hypothetical protein [Neisseria dentiae]|nr:hypothetical protein [Neisseria dentiae]